MTAATVEGAEQRFPLAQMVGVLLVVLSELEIFGRNISARLEIDERHRAKFDSLPLIGPKVALLSFACREGEGRATQHDEKGNSHRGAPPKVLCASLSKRGTRYEARILSISGCSFTSALLTLS